MRRLVATLGALLFLARPAAADDLASCLDAAGEGQKLRDAHKLVEARAQFRICAATSCPVVVQRDCLGWVSEADAAIPTIVLSGQDASGNDVLDVRVTVDGALLTTKLDGAALPIDPGPHQFRFEWPDGASVEREALVAEGQKAVVVSGRHPAAPPGAAPPPPLPTGPSEPSHGGAVRLGGYVVGAAGLATVVAGSILGGLTFAEVSHAKDACGAAGCAATTSPTAVNDMQTARTYGNASTALFVAGGALVAGGVVMVLVGRSSKAEKSALVLTPTWVAGRPALGLRGDF